MMRQALDRNELKRIYSRIANRYDVQHALVTARADQKGRKLLVQRSVYTGARVLDCGAGTGSTGLLAARKVGPGGNVVFFDLSDDMLAQAREKIEREGLQQRASFLTGDMVYLPFEKDSFDVVLSTYSLCPVYDPRKAALELYRVARPGGKIGVAHSTRAANPVVRWLAGIVEGTAWRFPSLSMGCRSVSILPQLQKAGGEVMWSTQIGFPLWPFLVFVIEKPVESSAATRLTTMDMQQ